MYVFIFISILLLLKLLLQRKLKAPSRHRSLLNICSYLNISFLSPTTVWHFTDCSITLVLWRVWLIKPQNSPVKDTRFIILQVSKLRYREVQIKKKLEKYLVEGHHNHSCTDIVSFNSSLLICLLICKKTLKVFLLILKWSWLRTVS